MRYRLPWSVSLLLVACPLPGAAHTLGIAAADTTRWNDEPWLIGTVLLSLLLYLRGHGRLRARRVASSAQLACFGSGWLCLAAALLSPIDTAGAASFAAHMVQHELLMIAAAPLLIAGRPVKAWLWALPAGWRKPVGRWFGRRAWLSWIRQLSRPLPAWLIHFAAVWGWHVPACFEAALRHEALHMTQHLSFFVSALLFWWSVLASWRRTQPDHGALLYLFSTMMHTSALGALLALSSRLWYPAYGELPWSYGISPLEDQQLGGLIMWIPGALSYVIVALVLCARWLKGGDDEAVHPA
ncbi:cytochrome c oxidase assembly protein [Herbaspirillum seropedicae]|uniref:Cytochrome c oxidase assembly protein n=1 Tax=Herbaspirillum seropedicae (strain SmR1) TaxID=757424 RepID=D8IV69_HERSS|nr:cytochrome c oxidase assembly protein [Herbaspirillum seropedicae]ADJ63808.1 conserved hypothetical protein [Herbaspirillum seropedicae SmR1]AKN65816.1 hypothetical protein ACP92_11550 [Herbaspirillum seropedicae]UMU21788.1 cytochrome c oxidase assembly protein [Herbaspirillum seropedicae]